MHEPSVDPRRSQHSSHLIPADWTPSYQCELVHADRLWSLIQSGIFKPGQFIGNAEKLVTATSLKLRDSILEFEVNIDPSLQAGPDFSAALGKEPRPRINAFTSQDVQAALNRSVSKDLIVKNDLVLRRTVSGIEVIAELPSDILGVRDEDFREFQFFPEHTKITTVEEFKKEMKLGLDILAVVLDLSERAYEGKPRNDIKRTLAFGPEIIPGENEGSELAPLLALLGLTLGASGPGSYSVKPGNPGESSKRYNSDPEFASLRDRMLVTNPAPIKFEDVKGQPQAVAALRDVVLEIQHPQTFERWGVDDPGHVLLKGPPGTGKTMIAKATAFEAGVPFLTLSGSMIASKWLGDLEKYMAMAFQIAEQEAENSPHKRAILFIDEIEALFPMRDSLTHEAVRKAINEALVALDGLQTKGLVKLIGATNRDDLLDSAMVSRLTHKIDVLLPNLEARAEIWQAQLDGRGKKIGKKVYGNVDFAELAIHTDGMSGRDIKNIVQKIVREKARASVNYGKNAPLITTEDLLNALPRQEPFGFARSLRPPSQIDRSASHEV